MTVQEFAKGYDVIEKRKPYNEFNIWYVAKSRLKGCKIGMPKFVLEKDGKFRFAKLPEETYEIMDAQRD